jgi:hypothetical protein
MDIYDLVRKNSSRQKDMERKRTMNKGRKGSLNTSIYTCISSASRCTFHMNIDTYLARKLKLRGDKKRLPILSHQIKRVQYTHYSTATP